MKVQNIGKEKLSYSFPLVKLTNTFITLLLLLMNGDDDIIVNFTGVLFVLLITFYGEFYQAMFINKLP